MSLGFGLRDETDITQQGSGPVAGREVIPFIRPPKTNCRRTKRGIALLPPGDGHRLRLVPLKLVDLADERFRCRVDLAVHGLRESIKRHGLQVPVVLRKREDGTYQVICGFRRTTAIKQLGWGCRRCTE